MDFVNIKTTVNFQILFNLIQFYIPYSAKF